MTFDVAIGNPPYNNDIYLKFCLLGNYLASKYNLWVVPSKWQLKADHENEEFRRIIVPHIRELIFYPDCLDVFGISEPSGITYFIVDNKREFEKTRVVNYNNYQPLVNNESLRDIRKSETLWNAAISIVDKLRALDKFRLTRLEDKDRLNYTVSISKMWCGSRASSGAWDFEKSCIKPEYVGKGGVIFNPTGNIKVLGKITILKGDEQNNSGSAYDIFTTNNLEEAKSFVSWIETKFISFLILIRISSSTIMNDSTLAYIPNPGEFNHIFTDKELYSRYNLSEQEINLIEALIK